MGEVLYYIGVVLNTFENVYSCLLLYLCIVYTNQTLHVLKSCGEL